MGDKPAILQSQEFVVEEGILYKAMRTGAIWMNKLFFSSLVLLGVWVLWAYAGGETGCVEGLGHQGNRSHEDLSSVADGECSVFLTPTAKFLGAMSILSFVLSLAFGALGLVVGKRVLEATAAADEVGAGPSDEESPAEQPVDAASEAEDDGAK